MSYDTGFTQNTGATASTYASLNALFSSNSVNAQESFSKLLSSIESSTKLSTTAPDYSRSASSSPDDSRNSLPLRTTKQADSSQSPEKTTDTKPDNDTPTRTSSPQNTDNETETSANADNNTDNETEAGGAFAGKVTREEEQEEDTTATGSDDLPLLTDSDIDALATLLAKIEQRAHNSGDNNNTDSANVSGNDAKSSGDDMMDLEALASLIDATLSEDEKQALFNGLSQSLPLDQSTLPAGNATEEALLDATHTANRNLENLMMNEANASSTIKQGTPQAGAANFASDMEALANALTGVQTPTPTQTTDNTEKTASAATTPAILQTTPETGTSPLALNATETPLSAEEVHNALTKADKNAKSSGTDTATSTTTPATQGTDSKTIATHPSPWTSTEGENAQKNQTTIQPSAQSTQATTQTTPQESSPATATQTAPPISGGTGSATPAPETKTNTTAGTGATAPSTTATPPLATSAPTQQNVSATAPSSFAQTLGKASGYNNNTPVTEQVAVNISHAAGKGEDRLTIRLHPADLGRIDVQLTINNDGNAKISITADQNQTLDMLQRDQKGLERALNDAGLKTDQSSLSFNLRDNNQQQSQQQAQSGGDNSRQNNTHTSDNSQQAANENDTATPTESTWIVSTSRLDVRI